MPMNGLTRPDRHQPTLFDSSGQLDIVALAGFNASIKSRATELGFEHGREPGFVLLSVILGDARAALEAIARGPFDQAGRNPFAR